MKTLIMILDDKTSFLGQLITSLMIDKKILPFINEEPITIQDMLTRVLLDRVSDISEGKQDALAPYPFVFNIATKNSIFYIKDVISLNEASYGNIIIHTTPSMSMEKFAMFTEMCWQVAPHLKPPATFSISRLPTVEEFIQKYYSETVKEEV